MSAVVRLRVAGLALAGLTYALDQWLKHYVRHDLSLPEVGTIPVFPGLFNLHWTQNYGVSLGMFSGDSLEVKFGLIGLTGVIALAVFVWLLREREWPEIVGLGLVLGGAAGNIRDRLGYGYVVDYLDVYLGEFHPFVFNLADAAITVGIAIVLARSFLSREKRAEHDAVNHTATES